MFYHSNEARSLRTYLSSVTKLLWFQHYSKSQMNKLFHSFHDLQQTGICWGRKSLLTNNVSATASKINVFRALKLVWLETLLVLWKLRGLRYVWDHMLTGGQIKEEVWLKRLTKPKLKWDFINQTLYESENWKEEGLNWSHDNNDYILPQATGKLRQ